MVGRLTQSNASGLVLLTAVSWFVYQAAGEGFLSSLNLFTLSQLAAQTAVIGFAQLVVIAIGRFNLAVGAIGLTVVMFTGWLAGTVGVHPLLAVLAGLVLGTVMGAFIGWVEIRTGLHSFIVTLAIQSVYIGIVLIVSNGVSVTTLPASITDFGSKWLFMPELSMLVFPALAIAVALWYLMRRSSFGWKMLAVGANQPAAELSGVRVSRVVIGSFALSGLLCGVAGVMEMARVAGALPSLGTDWLLPAFIVPILGGAFLTGGYVSISGAVMAAIFLESIAAGLVSLNVQAYWQQFAEAIVLLLAVVADQARRRRRQRTKSGHLLRQEVRQAKRRERAYA
jgi:ribose transport system permease protein